MLGSCRRDAGPVRVDRIGMIEYVAAWEAQRAHAEARRAGTGPDVLMLLEHHSVYTAGKRTQPEDRPTDGTPVIDVDPAAASPGTAPASSSATRSWRSPSRWTSSTSSGGSKKR
jgi:hypothetical protein